MKISQDEYKEQATRRKHVPQRSCVACRQVSDKRDLIRLVLSSELVEIDTKGKKPGRGVYLCASRHCWEKGLKGNRIEFGLRPRISAENRRMLLEYGISLPAKEVTR